MWLRANHSPSDEALARHHYTRERYNREIEDPPVKELESCKAGSYRVTINTHAITHMSFSDKPFLTATANHSSTEAADALNSLNLIESYARAFFDMYLKDKKSTLLSETASPTHSAVVDRYGSAK